MKNNTETIDMINTIYDQIGGREFCMMTGAKIIIAAGDGEGGALIKFKIMRNRAGTVFQVRYNAGTDLYDLTWCRRAKGMLVVTKKIDSLFFDQLRSVFEDVTGLDTRMPRIFNCFA